MTPTEEKPKRTPKEKPPSTSVFVSREGLATVMALKPPSDDQQNILRSAIVRKWPHVYELSKSDRVIEVLNACAISYTDTK